MLLSRVADSLYWISRYLERAEHTARLIDVRLDLGLDRTSNAGGWDFGRLYTMVRQEAGESAPENPTALSDALVFDAGNPASVLACVTAARENAAQVREEISSEMWEQLNALFLRLKQAQGRRRLVGAAALHLPARHRRHSPLQRRDRRDDGPRRRLAVPAGRPLPRARERDGGAGRSALPPRLAAAAGPRGVARACCARVRRSRPTAAATRPTCGRERIAEFLLLNAEFPRSVRFAAARVESALRAIAQPDRPEAPAGAPSGWPAGCTPRSTTGRWTRS